MKIRTKALLTLLTVTVAALAVALLLTIKGLGMDTIILYLAVYAAIFVALFYAAEWVFKKIVGDPN